ncbi:MAG: NUDIX domain-containing protein [Candidatus Pacebacteria bacterium]|nr:NUDIX domain-containing protein [Candidatus Paceibacterota bacterium]
MKISKDAQAVIYKKDSDVIEFLLLKRFDKDLDETHYRLVKGGIEDGESSKEASVRETKEETGLTNLVAKEKLDQYSYQAGDVQHDVDVFLIENTENEEIKIDSTNEGGFTIEGVEWVSSDEANEYLNFDQEKSSIKKALNIIQ